LAFSCSIISLGIYNNWEINASEHQTSFQKLILDQFTGINFELSLTKCSQGLIPFHVEEEEYCLVPQVDILGRVDNLRDVDPASLKPWVNPYIRDMTSPPAQNLKTMGL